MAPKEQCLIHFGKYRGKSVEALALSVDGYRELRNFAFPREKKGGKDDFESLRAFVGRVLDLADQVKVVQTCSCGKHSAVYAKYFVGSAMQFQSFHCDECKPSRRELADCYQLVELKFSSQLQFGDMYERERFVNMLVHAVGLSRPITATKAFRFFFPEEAAAQAAAVKKAIPQQLALALGIV